MLQSRGSSLQPQAKEDLSYSWDSELISKKEGAPLGHATRCLQLGAMSAYSISVHPLNYYEQALGGVVARQDRVLAGRLVGDG